MKLRVAAAVLFLLVLVASAKAHRLDEYLQTARLALTAKEVILHLDLTPGVAVAPQLKSHIHPDRKGKISRHNGTAYAKSVLRDVSLSLDGKPLSLTLEASSFPSWSELEAGEGTIQLRAKATFPRLGRGSHELVFHNRHLPGISVYLANALVPASKSIIITGQRRDERQTEYHLQFEVQATP